MKHKLIIYTMTTLLMYIGGQSAMAQAQKQQKLNKKSFSPKMLVYENLKNENVLKHFKNRFAQLDTLINNPIGYSRQSSSWDSTVSIRLTSETQTRSTGLRQHTSNWQ